VVSDNPVRDSKVAFKGLEQLHNKCFFDSGHNGCLVQLGELVDGDVQEMAATTDPGKGAKNIHRHKAKAEESEMMCNT
jgi:hypothetical protein